MKRNKIMMASVNTAEQEEQEHHQISSSSSPREEHVSLLASYKHPSPQQGSSSSSSSSYLQRSSLPDDNNYNRNDQQQHDYTFGTTPISSSIPIISLASRYKLPKSAKIVIFSILVIGIFCTTTLYNTVVNYKHAVTLQNMLSFPDSLHASSNSRSITTKDTPEHQEPAKRNSNDDDDIETQDDDNDDTSNGRSSIIGTSSNNRLGSLMNRLNFYGTKSTNMNHVNSNTNVMGDVVISTNLANTQQSENDGDEKQFLNDDEDSTDDDSDHEQKKNNDQDQQDTNDETLLFQQEIRKNFNASLYRNYREFKGRSQRFPSVAERVKMYMSNWYLPPILPCTDGNSSSDSGDIHDPMNTNIFGDFDVDPRVQYNYQIQVDPITKISNTYVILRQSQQLLSTTTNFFNNASNSILLQLDMIPQRTRNPFIYNHTYIVQYRSDHFLQDAYKHYIPSLQRLKYPDTSLDVEKLMQNGMLPPPIPIILQQGDAEQYKIYSPTIDMEIYRPFVPVIKKFRYSMSAEELERVTSAHIEDLDCGDKSAQQQIIQPTRISRTVRISDPLMREYARDRSKIPEHVQPIISILSNYERHFNPLNDVVTADRPWNAKKNMGVYRGALTGTNRATTPAMSKADKEKLDILYCQDVPRCSLVFNHAYSEYVDAKLVASKIKDERIPAIVGNISMFGSGMSFQQMLEYKAIIMLEGNDVSTGLKWSLYSNSVVLTPKPTCTSWAMEELLVPYVHYIPLYDNLTNVEEQVKWMIEHDEEAQKIAYNGKLWMMDLVYHTDVKRDTEEIIDETFRRYMKHFVYNPDLKI